MIVTCLLTMIIKVNMPSPAESVHKGVDDMKKVKTVRGFWGWILGEGWDAGGAGG